MEFETTDSDAIEDQIQSDQNKSDIEYSGTNSTYIDEKGQKTLKGGILAVNDNKEVSHYIDQNQIIESRQITLDDISNEDRLYLFELGYELIDFISEGMTGTVFSGICNGNSSKLIMTPNKEITENEDIAYLYNISGRLYHERNLEGSLCAIKVILNDSESTYDAYMLANYMIDITHPNIVEIYDIGLTQDYTFIVMEYINGITLNEFMSSFLFDEITAVEIIMQIVIGLRFLHNNEIIHNDLHGDNIMITIVNDELICKIIDFEESDIKIEDNQVWDFILMVNLIKRIIRNSVLYETRMAEEINDLNIRLLKKIIPGMNQYSKELHSLFSSYEPYLD